MINRFLDKVRAQWYARCRRIDMDILWPTCLQQAGDLERAKAAFAIHCVRDPAWRVLGEEAIFDFVGSLEVYD